MIVVATNKRDITADLVIVRMQEQEVPYVRLNTEDFPTRWDVHWLANSAGAFGSLVTQSHEVDLADVQAVWYRRPVRPMPPEDEERSPGLALAADESWATLRGLWRLIQCLWVSRPEHIRVASEKLGQLDRALRLGLQIPPTLLTSDPIRARDFCESYPEVIAKPLGSGRLGPPGDLTALIYTTLLTRKDLERLSDVRNCPTLLQAYIPKTLDLRVTVVGRQVFCTAIESQALPAARIDWRRGTVESLPHRNYVLPSDQIERILDYVKSFHLQFAALDFVVTPAGDLIFLEINPNGQWAWIELLIETPITDALVRLLRGMDQPL